MARPRRASRCAPERWISCDRVRRRVGSQRGLEMDDVDLYGRGVEAQFVAYGDDRVFTERLAQLVDGLVEQLAGVLGIAFRPEHGHELVACDAAIRRQRQQREQGHAMPLDGRPAHLHAVQAGEQRAAEKTQLKQLRGIHREFIARKQRVDRRGLL